MFEGADSFSLREYPFARLTFQSGALAGSQGAAGVSEYYYGIFSNYRYRVIVDARDGRSYNVVDIGEPAYQRAGGGASQDILQMLDALGL